MKFSHAYHSELDRLKPLFSAASEADREFHRAWKEGTAQMGVHEYKDTWRYYQTLDHFHQSCRIIDDIIASAFTKAKEGDPDGLPTLFAFLTFNDRYFHSGDQRGKIWRLLKRFALSDEQSTILQSIVLNQIEFAGPEFVEIARTSRKFSSAEFQESIKIMQANCTKNYIRDRIKRLLTILES
jgi:hypothetical protein